MSEQESSTQQHTQAEGGQRDADPRRRRRHKPGRRRPDERNQNTESNGEQTNRQASTQASTQSAPSVPAQPNTPESKQAGDSQSQRSRRNKRRRPDRQAEQPSQTGSANEAASSESTKDAKPSAPSQNDSKAPAPKPAEPRQGGRNQRREKQEREPQGSVLQRRLQREAKQRDEVEVDDFVPTTSAVNVNTVDAYIGQLRGWQREVVSKLRAIVKSQAPDAKETILWSQPVYTSNGPVVYIKAFSDHVNLGFWRGNELDDAANKLDGDLPTMRHVTIRHVNEVDRDLFESYVRQAFKLDRDKGDATA